jgi:hypothetical protein
MFSHFAGIDYNIITSVPEALDKDGNSQVDDNVPRINTWIL